MSREVQFKTPSTTSPKGSQKGCLCTEGKIRYSIECCDGSLHAQGLGNIYGVRAIVVPYYLKQENGDYLLQENNDKIILNG